MHICDVPRAFCDVKLQAHIPSEFASESEKDLGLELNKKTFLF